MFFFFNDTATTEIYTLSLHDALPISGLSRAVALLGPPPWPVLRRAVALVQRSEEHTSELQSRLHLVCRLLLEKKKSPTSSSWTSSSRASRGRRSSPHCSTGTRSLRFW